MRCKVNCAAFVNINMPQAKQIEAMQWPLIWPMGLWVPIYAMLDPLTLTTIAA